MLIPPPSLRSCSAARWPAAISIISVFTFQRNTGRRESRASRRKTLLEIPKTDSAAMPPDSSTAGSSLDKPERLYYDLCTEIPSETGNPVEVVFGGCSVTGNMVQETRRWHDRLFADAMARFGQQPGAFCFAFRRTAFPDPRSCLSKIIDETANRRI